MNKKSCMLALHTYVCNRPSINMHIVVLHGWGSASNCWQPLIPFLQTFATVTAVDLPGFGGSEELAEFSLEAVTELIAAHLPEPCVLMGWSLGGMLATQIAVRYPQKVSQVITLATNAKFVASSDYETAMAPQVNREFNQGFSADPAAAIKLFSGLLAQGDINERALFKRVRSLAVAESVNSNWQQALELLSQLDNRDAFTKLAQPGLHLLAEKDVLVPVSAAQSLTALNAQQQVRIIPEAAHALHWSQSELVAEIIKNFLLPPMLDKKQVAHSFSRAAGTYDSVAGLQRTVGELLLEKINANLDARVVIDLGCGTGHFSSQLREKFPEALIVGVDIAEGMLRFAREHHCDQQNWLCADAESLPFSDQSVDMIYSNFALQWCANLPRLFAELQRVLKPKGELIFTTLGPATLHELKWAWQQVDNRVHVNQFHDHESLLSDLQQQGFEKIEFDHKPVVVTFENLSDLTRSLKALGAHNVNSGRAAGLTGRKTIQAFRQAYENFRSNNLLPATYEVFYLKAKK